MNIVDITHPDVNNGLGCRITVWVSGCVHHCKGCHNPETWDFKYGRAFTDDDKKKIFEVLYKPYIKGITFSGGDPLCSYTDVLSLAREIKEKYPDKDIWVYTGFSFEYVREHMSEILDYVDYIVDGKFKIEERDVSLAFRGSKNQRIWKKEEEGTFNVIDLDKGG
jgi:anaerobic ribonucleoside-triphosphate reductase activating protein